MQQSIRFRSNSWVSSQPLNLEVPHSQTMLKTQRSFAASEEHGLCWAFLITNTRWFRRPDMNNWTDLPANVLLQVNPLSSKCWSTVCLRSITLTSTQALQISFFWKPNCFTQVNCLHSAKTVPWMGCSKMKYKKFVLSKRIWKNAFSCFRSAGIKFHCLNFTTATQEGASRKLWFLLLHSLHAQIDFTQSEKLFSRVWIQSVLVKLFDLAK